MFKPQKDFPLLEEYNKVFAISDRTIFAYDNCIYCNYPLTDDLIIHEETHFKQQDKYGLDEWVTRYLTDDVFRLDMEVEAYRKQLASIKDREVRNKVRIVSAKQLSSDLYGDIIEFSEAFRLLK